MATKGKEGACAQMKIRAREGFLDVRTHCFVSRRAKEEGERAVKQ